MTREVMRDRSWNNREKWKRYSKLTECMYVYMFVS